MLGIYRSVPYKSQSATSGELKKKLLEMCNDIKEGLVPYY